MNEDGKTCSFVTLAYHSAEMIILLKHEKTISKD